MTDKRDVELVIRARDLGSKTFKEVAAAVREITGALDQQISAASRGEASAAELKATFTKLKEAGDALIKQQGVIDLYRDLAVQLDAAKTKAASARTEYDKLHAALAGSGEITKEQARQLASLEKSANLADKGVERLSNRMTAHAEVMDRVGLDTANLDKTQEQLVASAQQVGNALTAVGGALDGYHTNLRQIKDAEEQLAAVNAFERQNQDLQQLRGSAAFLEAYGNSVVGATVSEREFAEVQAFRQKAAQARQLVQAGEYVQFWTQALDQAEAKERALAELNTFQQVGAKAVQAAQNLNVYTAAADNAAPASQRIASSLRAILDPGAEAIRTLGGLETAVTNVSTQIGEAKGPIRDYQDAIYELDRIQKAVLKSAAAIDSYKEQAAAVKAAEQAFQQAKAEVVQYGQAIATADAPNTELTASLKAAEAQLQATSQEYGQQSAKLKAMEKDLVQAGIEVNNLAKSEQRLGTVATQTAGAVQKLANASAGKNSRAGRFLGLRPYELQNLSFQLNDVFTQIASGTSITQTFAQQGGQFVQLFPRMFAGLIPFLPVIVAVGSALAVVGAALNQIAELNESQREFQRTLLESADSAEYDANNLAELSHEMDVLGGSLKDARAAVKIFVQEGLDPSRLEEFSKAALDVAENTGKKLPEAAKLLTDSFAGGYEQIKKLDDEFDFLTAAEDEQIRAMFDSGKAAEARTLAFDKFAEKQRNAANESRTDWEVSVRNLTEAWDGFLHTIGDSAFINNAVSDITSLISVVKELTDLLPKAKAKGQEAQAVAKAQPKPIIRSVRELTTPFGVGMIALRAADAAFKGRQAEKDAAAIRNQGSVAVDAANKVKKAAGETGDVLDATSNKAQKTNNAIIRGLELQLETTKGLTEARRIQLAGEKAANDAANNHATADEVKQAKALGEEIARTEIAKEKSRAADRQARKDEAAARRQANKDKAEQNERDRLEAQLTNDLRSETAKIDKQQAGSLEARLDAVDQAYAKIFDTIQKFKEKGGSTIDGQTIDQYTAAVNANKQILQQQETLKFYGEQINALEQQREDRLKAIEQNVKDGNITAAEGYDQARQVADDLQPKIAEIAGIAKEFAESIRGAAPDPKLEAFIEKMGRIASGAMAPSGPSSPAAGVGMDLLKNQESELEAILQQRAATVQNLNQLVELGAITQTEAQARAKDAYAQVQPLIAQQIVQQKQLLDTLLQTGAIIPAVYDAWIAKLQVVQAESQFTDARMVQLKQSVENAFTSAATDSVHELGDAINQAAAGTAGWQDVVEAAGDAVQHFVGRFLQGIADIMLQIALMQAIQHIPFLDQLSNGIGDATGLITGAAALSAPATALAGAAAGLNTAGPGLAIPAGALAAGATTLAGVPIPLGTAAAALTAAAAAMSAAAIQMQAAAAAAAAAQAASTAASILHGGGRVGGISNRSRSVSPAVFAGAPRYHNGTVVGLAPDEQAAILQKGEEVLSKSDPRNIVNGGGVGGRLPVGLLQDLMGRIKLKVVNAVDPGDMLEKGLASKSGERALLNFFRNNPSAVRGAGG